MKQLEMVFKKARRNKLEIAKAKREVGNKKKFAYIGIAWQEAQRKLATIN